MKEWIELVNDGFPWSDREQISLQQNEKQHTQQNEKQHTHKMKNNTPKIDLKK